VDLQAGVRRGGAGDRPPQVLLGGHREKLFFAAATIDFQLPRSLQIAITIAVSPPRRSEESFGLRETREMMREHKFLSPHAAYSFFFLLRGNPTAGPNFTYFNAQFVSIQISHFIFCFQGKEMK